MAGLINVSCMRNPIAGVEIPADMQGKSLVPILKGETPADWRDKLYYHYYEFPGTHSVRRHEGVFTGRYKLIRFYGVGVPEGEEWELFDLEKDPKELKSEYHNPEYASIVAKLKNGLQELRVHYEVTEIPQRER